LDVLEVLIHCLLARDEIDQDLSHETVKTSNRQEIAFSVALSCYTAHLTW